MMKKEVPYLINSISELHRILQLPKPLHPMVCVIDFEQITCFTDESIKSMMYNFYSVSIKKGFEGKLKYGQNFYDFDEGIMTFLSPGQVFSAETSPDLKLSGWWLVVHPDFLRNYTVSKTIKEYGFFSYAANEALHLSEKEELQVAGLMKNIQQEYESSIDAFSQDVIISHIELILTYCNRFYNRQFITRKNAGSDLLIHLEELLSDYFNGEKVQESGLPSVQYIAEKLNVSPNYLSDMLRALTGQSTQQHIHDKLIEKAKEVLTTTSLSVSEIAYRLGFEYPQSFSKLFKNKTRSSPLEFRHSFLKIRPA